jgi:hypothetical protein
MMTLRVLALAATLTACGGIEPADTVLWNGRIVTLGPEGAIAEALAVKDGRIVAVGSGRDVLAHAGPGTKRLDLGGRTVVPGFSDNHYHSIGGGPGVDLSRTRSLDEVHAAIAARAAGSPEEELIVTNSDWHEGQLREQRLPYRDDLDRAAPRHAVVVVRGGHEYILNSAALARFGIDESTHLPEAPEAGGGGRIGRYPDGRLNGELVDEAKRLVALPSRPERSEEERLRAMREEYRRLTEVGLTSIRLGSASAGLYRDLQTLRARGELPLRVSVLLRLGPSVTAASLDSALEELGAGPDDGDEWVRVAGIKLGVDGGFEGGLMREPYEEPWGENGAFRGLQTFEREPYFEIVRGLNQRGWRVATHAVGDAAIDLVLDAYESADGENPIAGRRWAIEHGFIARPDHFPRMKALGVHVAAQHHLYLAAPSLLKYWGPARASEVTPLRSYLDAGIPVSLGTDSPVVPYPPLWVLYHFVTRDTISAGVQGAEQKVTREEALRSMTVGGAALTLEEDRKGTLEVGKLADLVVLEEDYLTCPPERIRDMEIALTMVGGELAFDNGVSSPRE